MNVNTSNLTKENLSKSDLLLIKLMSRVYYGTINAFPVRNGEPVLDPEPEIEIQEKIGVENAKMPSIWNGKYLHPNYSDLIRRIKQMPNGWITQIDIHDGLPFKISKRSVAIR